MIEAPIPSAKEHVVKVGCLARKQWAQMLVLRVDHVVLEFQLCGLGIQCSSQVRALDLRFKMPGLLS